MKNQIHLIIRAHLIGSAFYMLLLMAVCVIPFALAQRNATRQSAAKRGSAVVWQVSKEQALQIQKISDELVGAQSPTSQMIANGSHRVET
jgi:hypothetical protein